MLIRALLVLFSVLNLGVAAWWIAHDPPPQPTAAPLPGGAARLQLITERVGARAQAPGRAAAAVGDRSAAPLPSANPTTVPSQQQCFSFGPFASQNAAAAAAAGLKPLVQKLTTREQAGTATPARGWRVYLAPFPSLEQAQAAAQRIGAAGFDDFLVVRDGAEANSIALGRYRNEEGAKKRADALIAAGFAAQTAALGQPGPASVWVDVVADEAFDPRRAQASITAVQYRKSECLAR